MRTGFLRLLFRGTYAVGHPHPHAWLHAALIVGGERSALSHDTATALLELLPRHPGPIHVTTKAHVRSRTGLVVHRATLEPSELIVSDALVLTSAVRTLHDLAATADAATLAKALDAAHARRLVTATQLQTSIVPGRSGATRLREVLHDRPGFTRSEAERLLLALFRRAQLPQPRTNVRLHGYEVDFLFPEARLVVEVDGYAFHSSPRAFERDRRRDADLLARGYRTLRLTWRELTERPEAVAVRVATLLSTSG